MVEVLRGVWDGPGRGKVSKGSTEFREDSTRVPQGSKRFHKGSARFHGLP